MADEDLGYLIADRKARVERRHRLLKNHRQPVAAQIAHFVVRQAEQIAAVEQHRAVHLRVLRQQAHQRERRDALAATGFADDPERGPERDVQVDLIDRVRHAAAVAVEGDPQARNLDQRRAAHVCDGARRACSISASIAARSVMPFGLARLGRHRMKWTNRSRLTLSSRSSSASGSA